MNSELAFVCDRDPPAMVLEELPIVIFFADNGPEIHADPRDPKHGADGMIVARFGRDGGRSLQTVRAAGT